MGTRGAWGFRYQETDKMTYNHFDSYPTGLGADACKAIRTFNDEQLAGAAARITLISDDDPPTPEQIERYRPFSDTGVSTGQLTEWYCLLRQVQGEMTPFIDGRVDHMPDGTDFLGDSLFCEWAYILNMDAQPPTLEVYKGFNEDPAAPGRYANAQVERNTDYLTKYRGVSLLIEVPLQTIRNFTDEGVDEWLTEVERTAYPEDDE